MNSGLTNYATPFHFSPRKLTANSAELGNILGDTS